MRKPFSAALLFLLMSLSVICYAEPYNNALSAKPYSWIPVEAFVAVGMLLKSDWNSNSLLFNTADQPKASQDHPFAISTMVLPGQGQQKNDQQSQASASSNQQASGTNTHLKNCFAQFQTCRRDGNGNPEQPQHTFGLKCYVDSCNGVCRFRSPADSSTLPEASDECPICCEAFTNTILTPCCSQKIDKHCLQEAFEKTGNTCPYCREDLSFLAQSPDFSLGEADGDCPICHQMFRDDVLVTPCCSKRVETCCLLDALVWSESGHCPFCTAGTLSVLRSLGFIASAEAPQDLTGSVNGDLPIVGEDGPCQRVYKYVRDLIGYLE
ncbi:hypothetical protein [Endozoicomonas sp. 8E]|uniref:hypothetical protein n=1 Tax=Endozoicomonas sp. 8E TaxID=3035692 RepID=UPI002939129F|nr:hypothetical protein [Endozoicomonas sp. 8E]WOG27325.1 hypothetical protein P6910_22685 [Endozoicomonas sp. 8E]